MLIHASNTASNHHQSILLPLINYIVCIANNYANILNQSLNNEVRHRYLLANASKSVSIAASARNS